MVRFFLQDTGKKEEWKMKRILLVLAVLAGVMGCATMPDQNWLYGDPYSGLLQVEPRAEVQFLFSNPNYGTSLFALDVDEKFQLGRIGRNSINGGIGMMGIYRF